MLRSKQYIKLYKRYHSLWINQDQQKWNVCWRAYKALLDMTLSRNVLEWRKLREQKNL